MVVSNDFVLSLIFVLIKLSIVCGLPFMLKAKRNVTKETKKITTTGKVYRLFLAKEGETIGYFPTLNSLSEEALMYHTFKTKPGTMVNLKSFKTKLYGVEAINIEFCFDSSKFKLTKNCCVGLDECYSDGFKTSAIYKRIESNLKDKAHVLVLTAKYVSGISLTKDEQSEVITDLRKVIK